MSSTQQTQAQSADVTPTLSRQRRDHVHQDSTFFGSPLVNAPRQLKEALECSVCACVFEDPKQLTCGHTYCSRCVDRLVETAVQQQQQPQQMFYLSVMLGMQQNHQQQNLTSQEPPKVPCPQCRALSSVPPNGFHTNYTVKEVIGTLKAVESEEKKQKYGCQLCKRLIDRSEVFTCKTCKNAVKFDTLMCSVCAIKYHRGHECDFYEGFVTRESREKTAAEIAKCSSGIDKHIQKLRALKQTIIEEIGIGIHKCQDHLQELSHLQVDCLTNESLLIESDLAERLTRAKSIYDSILESTDLLVTRLGMQQQQQMTTDGREKKDGNGTKSKQQFNNFHIEQMDFNLYNYLMPSVNISQSTSSVGNQESAHLVPTTSTTTINVFQQPDQDTGPFSPFHRRLRPRKATVYVGIRGRGGSANSGGSRSSARN